MFEANLPPIQIAVNLLLKLLADLKCRHEHSVNQNIWYFMLCRRLTEADSSKTTMMLCKIQTIGSHYKWIQHCVFYWSNCLQLPTSYGSIGWHNLPSYDSEFTMTDLVWFVVNCELINLLITGYGARHYNHKWSHGKQARSAKIKLR